MYCRRCCSPHLLRLEKKLPQDNEVFRCQECGFLFSPSGPDRTDRLGQPASDCGMEASDSRLQPEARSLRWVAPVPLGSGSSPGSSAGCPIQSLP